MSEEIGVPEVFITADTEGKLAIRTNLSIEATNWFLDQAKFLLLTGDGEVTDV